MQPAAVAPLDPGSIGPASLAGSLAEWVTARHLLNAAHPVVYRGADRIGAEPALASAVNESDRFVAETARLLGAATNPHRNHPYWAGALDHHQATALQPVDRAVLEAILGPGGAPKSSIGGMRQRLLGRMPMPRPWHPHWIDLRAVRACITMLAAGRSLLIVSAEPDRVRLHLTQAAHAAGASDVTHLEPEEIVVATAEAGRASAPGSFGYFDAALLVVRPSDAGSWRALCDAVVRIVAADAHIVLALSDLSDADARAVTADTLQAVAMRQDQGLRMTRMETVPAPRWRLALQAEMMAQARAAMGSVRILARLSHLAAAAACAALSLAANLVCLRGGKAARQAPCSTALFHLVRQAGPPPQPQAPQAHASQAEAPQNHAPEAKAMAGTCSA